MRMELDQVNFTGNNQYDHRSVRQHLTNNGRFISLRKYTPAICLLEALIIAFFIGYLSLRSPQSTRSANGSHGQPPSTLPFNVIAYTNGANSSTIRIGLVDGCDQRKHDLKFGVKCESKNTTACQPIDPSNSGTSTGDLQAKRTVTIITTSKAGLRLSSEKLSPNRVRCPFNAARFGIHDPCRFKTQLNVDLSQRGQEILGWGGALSDSSINNILSLSTNGTIRLLDDYFGNDGLMFNMVRITIGGSDFSSRFYTNDDINLTESKNDFNMDKFHLTEEDLLYKIPMLKYIQDHYRLPDRQLRLFASMWSPPTWMKTNRHFNKGQLIGTDQSEKDAGKNPYYKALAELKRKFLLAYQDNSIRFWGLTVMNEPLFAIQPFLPFNTMIFPEEDYGTYVAKYLGPVVRADARLKHIKLIVHDDNRRYLMNYTDPILSKKDVRKFIDGISVHGYVDQDYDLMDEILMKHKQNDANFFILPTELCSGHLPFMEKAIIGNWHRGIHYGLDIIRSLQHSAAGWVDWNMALDIDGGPGWLGGKLDSPVIVDKGEDAFYKSPMFYVLGHFSRYIPPKSVKIKTDIINDSYDYHFETVTFLLPYRRDLVTVVLNANPYPIELNIRLMRDSIGSPSDSLHQVSCAADSITTIVYPIVLD